jgi:hypothetical protein
MAAAQLRLLRIPTFQFVADAVEQFHIALLRVLLESRDEGPRHGACGLSCNVRVLPVREETLAYDLRPRGFAFVCSWVNSANVTRRPDAKNNPSRGFKARGRGKILRWVLLSQKHRLNASNPANASLNQHGRAAERLRSGCCHPCLCAAHMQDGKGCRVFPLA